MTAAVTSRRIYEDTSLTTLSRATYSTQCRRPRPWVLPGQWCSRTRVCNVETRPHTQSSCAGTNSCTYGYSFCVTATLGSTSTHVAHSYCSSSTINPRSHAGGPTSCSWNSTKSRAEHWPPPDTDRLEQLVGTRAGSGQRNALHWAHHKSCQQNHPTKSSELGKNRR